MRGLMKSIANLEELVKERLQATTTAQFERLKLVNQLVRYGICTCHCHYSASVYHSAAPCCGNAELTART
jgi:hypothetical protein